jgi:hypothetical protein
MKKLSQKKKLIHATHLGQNQSKNQKPQLLIYCEHVWIYVHVNIQYACMHAYDLRISIY